MASLTLKHIEKVYENGFKAVKDFNLEVADHEFIILVGPSGCGKSTTLRMIAGLEDITAGDLLIDGVRVNDVEPKDRDIAMVFQNYALYPHMTVFDNMAFGLKLRKLPKDEIRKKVEDAAAILDLTPLLDRKPKQLSGGQRQRVAMGRAIVRNPKVFLMDEPLSNLDAKLRVQMRTEISKLHQRLNATIIYVTHDQIEAMTLGTRIVVMNDGIVQQVDTPENLYSHPDNLFVASFIGSPQMNLIACTVSEEEKGIAVLTYEDHPIRMNAEKSKKLIDSGYVGKKVMLGVRPEDMHDPNYSLKDCSESITAKISVREMVGAEIYLYFEIAGVTMTARVDPKCQYHVGEDARLLIDTDKVHIFDIETEKKITD